MKKFLLKIGGTCSKQVVIEAETEEKAKELALQGKGVQIGQHPRVESYDTILEIKSTEMEL